MSSVPPGLPWQISFLLVIVCRHIGSVVVQLCLMVVWFFGPMLFDELGVSITIRVFFGLVQMKFSSFFQSSPSVVQLLMSYSIYYNNINLYR